MMSNIRNYREQGGERTVISGELEITEEGKLIFNGKELKPAERQEDSNASTVEALKDDYNHLLQKLKDAGLMK
nr:Head fiber protein [Natranaerovirga pectinivora]